MPKIDESNLVRTRYKSNYVIKDLHQTTNNGDVYERDITTIGGRNFFDKNQKPVYRSGNFIITVSNEQTTPIPPSEIIWETPPSGEGELWTWGDVENITEEEDSSVSLELKPDVYDLRNFAYYGSCAELIRASLNHIISTFPGEVYSSDQELQYKDKNTQNYAFLSVGEYKYLVDNQFGLNLHSKFVESYFVEEDPLKYLLVNDFFAENYVFISDKTNETGNTISSITYVPKQYDKDCVPPYSEMGTLTIVVKDITPSITIKVCKLVGDEYVYLHKEKNDKWHIRPKNKHYANFRKNLSIFEKVLLSEDTLPKYSPYFEIYTQTDYGFEAQMQKFEFPIDTNSGYNLSFNSIAYTTYIEKLSRIGEIYDNVFCDNLYRCMTHEAITNFDWSYQRDENSPLAAKHIEGGTKMQKILRIIAREFDEIKLYIDGIKDANKITYNGNGNLPDYLLTDYLENEGWDYLNTIPFVKKAIDNFPTVGSDEIIQPYKKTATFPDTDSCDGKKNGIVSIKTHVNNKEYTPNDVNNLFIRLLSLNSKPIWRKKGTIDAIDSLLSLFGLKNKNWVESLNKIRGDFDPSKSCNENVCTVYGSLEQYSSLNHCKTDTQKNCSLSYDYEIIEYDYQDVKKEYIINTNNPADALKEKELDAFYDINNVEKLIAYTEDANFMSTSTPWRGLLTKEKYEVEEKNNNGTTEKIEKRILFPWFDKNKENDGNPYYQMYGGWMNRTLSVGTKIDGSEVLNEVPYYSETISKIRGVHTIKSLMELPKSLLHDGDICYVSDMSKKYIIIDGIVYELSPCDDLDDWFYFSITVRNNSVVVGKRIYYDSLYIKEPIKNKDGEYKAMNRTKPIDQYKDGSIVRVYVHYDSTKPWESQNDFSLSDAKGTVPKTVTMISSERFGFSIKPEDLLCCEKVCSSEDFEVRVPGQNNSTPTHYFVLKSVKNSDRITPYSEGYWINQDSTTNDQPDFVQSEKLGWCQLCEDDPEYQYAKSLTNYYDGNNPHTHAFVSDLGEEYIRYFSNLFKYSVENNLFDYETIYDRYANNLNVASRTDLINKIKDFGFSSLLAEPNHDPTKQCEPACSRIRKPDVEENFKILVANRDKESDLYKVAKENGNIYSDSIINTKLVEIKFYNCGVISDEYKKGENNVLNEKFKYINNVVLHYLSQVIPSTLIVKITYDSYPNGDTEKNI